MLIELVHNAALLVALVVLWQQVQRVLPSSRRRGAIAQGVLFGAIGILAMATPVRFEEGVIFDPRSVVLPLAGLVAGPLAAVVAGAMCAAYRIHLGGAGAPIGVVVIAAAAGLGLLLHVLRRRDLRWVSVWRLLGLGFGLHVLVAALLTRIPGGAGWAALPEIAPAFLVVFPILFALLGTVFVDAERREAERRAGERSERLLEESGRLAAVGGWEFDPAQGSLFLTDQAQKVLGLESGKLEGIDVARTLRRLPPFHRERTVRTLRACAESGGSFDIDLRMDPPDGHGDRWLRAVGSAVVSEGRCIRVRGAIQDITEQRNALDRIRRSEQLLDRAGEAARIGGWDLDLRTRALSWSRETRRLHQVPDSYQPNLDEAAEFFHPDDRPALHLAFDRLLAQGKAFDLELRALPRGGDVLWVRVSGRLELRDGKPIRAYGSFQDISEERRREEALRASEARFRLLVDGLPIPLLLADRDERVVFANPAFTQVLGWTLEDVPNAEQWWLKAYPDPARRAKAQAQWIPAARRAVDERGIVPFHDYPIACKDGSERVCGITGVMTDQGMLVTFLDQTERKEAEAALRASEERFRNLIEEIEAFPAQAYDDEFRVSFWNRASEGLYGWTRDEVMGRNGFELLVPEEEREGLKAMLDAWVAGGPAPPPGELRLQDKHGNPVVVFSSMFKQMHPDGSWEIFSIDMDLTPLRAAEARFRALFDESPVTILVHDSVTGELLDANRAACAAYGCSGLDELKALGLWDEPPYSQAEAQELIRKAREEGIQQFEWRSRRKDGSSFWEQVTLAPVVIDGERRILSTGVDISAIKAAEQEKEALQAQLLHSQKLQAVGELAGGVAHDFNNLLQAIGGYAECLEASIVGEDAVRALKEIRRNSDRAAALTRQLLLFSRRQAPDLKPVDLNHLVHGMLDMLSTLLGERVLLEFSPGKGMGLVRADPGMIEQVVLNLCVNARDAMPGGGTIRVETVSQLFTPEYCARHPWALPGAWVGLKVSDTGVGIPPEDRDRIFEPFFSTKDPDKGTGLGLATVYGIVEQHDGLIHLESEVGTGSTFWILLPEVAPADPSRADSNTSTRSGAASKRPASSTADPASGTILVAEDNQSVRDLAMALLRHAGYAVEAVENGRLAVELFQSRPDDFCMAMLDAMMPELGGVEAAAAMRAIRPDLPVLFASGYSEEFLEADFPAKENFRLLQKPYKRDDLMAAIRQTLAGEEASAAVPPQA